MVDVAHGLEYLHSLHVVHGDLKGVRYLVPTPQSPVDPIDQANILINKDHRACLTDFGHSTIVYVPPHNSGVSSSAEAPRTWAESEVSLVPHTSGGTIRWISPELLYPAMFGLDDSRPTKQSDCYALGMVVYEVRCNLIAVKFPE